MIELQLYGSMMQQLGQQFMPNRLVISILFVTCQCQILGQLFYAPCDTTGEHCWKLGIMYRQDFI